MINTALKTVLPAALVFLAVWFGLGQLVSADGTAIVSEVTKALISFGGAVAAFFIAKKYFGKE